MAIPHIVVLAAALLALLCLPCAVALLLYRDQLVLRRSWRRRDPAALRRLHRLELGPIPATPRVGGSPCIEQIAAELRRLHRQLRSGPTIQSTLWLTAVLLAYDEWLRLACRSLGIVEHLQPLDGIDREMERVRVEDQLKANGMRFG